MTSPADNECYKNHRFPGDIISHGAWLYYRFPLSYRDVEELLFVRGHHDVARSYSQVVSQVWAGVRHFHPRRHLLAAPAYRQEMRQRFQVWREITGTARAG